jgi:predicted RND superfamily exporter protein
LKSNRKTVNKSRNETKCNDGEERGAYAPRSFFAIITLMFFHPKMTEFLPRPLRLLIIGGSVLLFVFFVWSAAESRKNANNRVADWLPQGTQELETFRYYFQHFPEAEYLMVSWKDCDVEDIRLDILAARLTAPPDDNSPHHFAEAMTTRSVIDMLTDAPARLTRDDAIKRLTGWMIGKDRQTACLVLVPPSGGLKHPAEAIEFLFTTAEQVTQLPRSDIYVAGPSIDSVAIDEISAKSQRTLLPFFLLFSLFLLLCCLRHLFAAFLVFWVAMINEELAGTLLFWCGAHVDSVSLLTSALIYVLTISGGVHLINYYRETLAEMHPGEEKNAPIQTFYKALHPCFLATFTTILGMGSLAVSKMVPIQTFGIYASLGLFFGTIWFFVFILSVLQEFPIRQWSPNGKHQAANIDEQGNNNFWGHFGFFVFRWQTPITVVSFLSLAVFAFGIKDLRTSVSFHGLLPKEAKVLRDYRTLEDQIGGLIPIEVVVHFPYEETETTEGVEMVSPPKMFDQVYFLGWLISELRHTENVDTTISVLNFLPTLPAQSGSGFRTVAERAGIDSVLTRSQDQLRELRFFNFVEQGKTDAGSFWRISLRVSTQKKLDYATMIADVEKRLETVREQRGEKNVRFSVTGAVPLVFRAQELLLRDLIYSFLTAFCLITLTMMIVLRGVVRGLLAMIPNIFPCAIVFGMLGLCGMPVDMGSMMTASVALGISLDGTLHLLAWMNLGIRRGLSRKDAVLYALQCCSTALFQTAVICGIGMLVFGMSDFVPVSRFAVLLCIVLAVSLIGDLIALPAILFGPLGRFFEGNEKDF